VYSSLQVHPCESGFAQLGAVVGPFHLNHIVHIELTCILLDMSFNVALVLHSLTCIASMKLMSVLVVEIGKPDGSLRKRNFHG
jgi:hypothetical protein